VGSSSFSGVAGELRVFDTGQGHWRVQGDLNGDRIADFALDVFLSTSNQITSSDFVL
jgi:serralysin